MTGIEMGVQGHKLLPYERRWIRRRVAKDPKTVGASGGPEAERVLRLASLANWMMLRNLALVVMVIAFAMAAITSAHGGPLEPSGTPMHAWEIAFTVAWWLLIAACLLFLILGIARRVQASRAARPTPGVDELPGQPKAD
ncbi:hypothetical protein [Oryzihumus leptocrescens]|uniref:hypothetical protein n=1 Tax=Oryzihumus leptocrescens TaxID=297536 RepID=UPI001153D26F|nr:hypothetical protein [Oryzihumus leptocrescens]